MIRVIGNCASKYDIWLKVNPMETATLVSKIINSFSYNEYKNLVISCSERSTTTGIEQSDERIAATKINAHRMKRIDKQIQIDTEIISLLKNKSRKLEWIILAESWCGDGAQNIPIISKIADIAPHMELKIILRDDNPEIMEKYLTNGSRAIPKLICLDGITKQVLGTWGPRPTQIQQLVKEYKNKHPSATHEEFVGIVHLWYAKDKGESLQKDLKELLPQWLSA